MSLVSRGLRRKGLVKLGIFLALYNLVFPPKVYAYLDLGSGSYVTQLVAAFLLGGFVGLKGYWRKIKDFFTARFIKKKDGKGER